MQSSTEALPLNAVVFLRSQTVQASSWELRTSVSPGVPYVPLVQLLGLTPAPPAPPALHWPAATRSIVSFVVAASGHVYPGGQMPEQSEELLAATLVDSA